MVMTALNTNLNVVLDLIKVELLVSSVGTLAKRYNLSANEFI